MMYFFLCFWQWVKFTPYFFLNAPVHRWHTYFDSCYRVSTSVAYAKMELAQCEDGRERNVRYYQMLDVVNHNSNERNSQPDG